MNRPVNRCFAGRITRWKPGKMRLRDRAALLVCLFLLLPLPCALFGRKDLLQSHSNGVATGHLRNLGMVLRSINRKVFVARFSLAPFPKSIFKLDSHINYDGLPLMVDVPFVFLRVSQNLKYMRTARLSGTKAINSKVEDLGGPKWKFIGKMLPTDFKSTLDFAEATPPTFITDTRKNFLSSK